MKRIGKHGPTDTSGEVRTLNLHPQQLGPTPRHHTKAGGLPAVFSHYNEQFTVISSLKFYNSYRNCSDDVVMGLEIWALHATRGIVERIGIINTWGYV